MASSTSLNGLPSPSRARSRYASDNPRVASDCPAAIAATRSVALRARSRASLETVGPEPIMAQIRAIPTIAVPVTRESLRGETIIQLLHYRRDHVGDVIHTTHVVLLLRTPAGARRLTSACPEYRPARRRQWLTRRPWPSPAGRLCPERPRRC